MTSARDIPDAIQWHEGMLLAPQHFQQAQLRQDLVLQYHTSQMAPYHWGVVRLEFDRVLLIEGTVRVAALEAIMRDGLVVSHDSPVTGSDDSLKLDLSDQREQLLTEGPRRIHLVVPERRPSGAEVTGQAARYRMDPGRKVVDANTGDGELAVPRLKPRLRLADGKEPPPGHTSIPLAEITYSDEKFGLTTFVPPMLRVPQSSSIGALCSALATRIREKATVLSEQITSQSAAQGTSQLLQTRILVHALTAELPRFEALLRCDNAHPFDLYTSLMGLVGQAAAVGVSPVPPVLPPYDHQDIWRIFDKSRRFVMKALDEGIVEAFSSYKFVFQKGVFAIDFPEAWMSRELFIGVRGAPGVDERHTAAWVQESLIGSQEHFASMRKRRVLGAARRPVQTGELVPARGVLLYSIQPDPAFIQPDQPLLISNLEASEDQGRPVEIALYVRNAS